MIFKTMLHTKKIIFQGGPLDQTSRRVDVNTTQCEVDVQVPIKEEGAKVSYEIRRLTYKKSPLKSGDIETFKLVEDDKQNNNV